MCSFLPETSIWVGGAGATPAGDVPQMQPVRGSQCSVYCQRRHGGSCASHHWGWRPAQPLSSQCESLLLPDTLPRLLINFVLLVWAVRFHDVFLCSGKPWEEHFLSGRPETEGEHPWEVRLLWSHCEQKCLYFSNCCNFISPLQVHVGRQWGR